MTKNYKLKVPTYGKPPQKESGFLAWFWYFWKPFKWSAVWYSAVRLFRFTAMALIAFFVGKLIEGIEAGKLQTDPWAVWQWLWIMTGTYIFCYAALWISYYDSLLRDRTQRYFCYHVISHMLTLPISWHEREGSGSRMQKIMAARTAFKSLNETFVYNILPFTGDVIALAISIYFLNIPAYFMLLFMGFIGMYILVGVKFQKSLMQRHRDHNMVMETLSSRVYDFVASVRTIKNFSLTEFIRNRAVTLETSGHEKMVRVMRVDYNMWIINNFVGLFWTVAIMGLSIWLAQHGDLSIGAIAAVFAFLIKIWGWLEYFLVILSGVTENAAAFMRVPEILVADKDRSDLKPAAPMAKAWSKLQLDDVSFVYDGTTSAVIQNVDMTFERGQKIAFVGHSGSGKSTLIKLIMKMALPTSGTINIDGQNIANIPRDELLQTMAIVPQDVELFNGTIKENILIGQDKYDEDFYQDCIERAYLKDFIQSLENGDETEIGERGLKLSGGQRQRLGIARALAKKPEIIVFDEATSALDSESEAFIQKSIEESFADKTMIIIAHRLSTIKFADNIYVMNNGGVAEQGSFQDLEEKSVIFKKLWSMQSNGFV